MKKIYLIHGWGGDKNFPLFNWIEKELGGKSEVISFNMPNTNNPKIEEWVGFLQKNIKDIDSKSYFIGHSIGCQTILRFLENLSDKTKVAGSIFIAGWFNLKGLEADEKEIAGPWLNKKIDFNKVNKHCNNFLAIFSDNDCYVPLEDNNLFKERLNAKIIIKHNEEHFNNTRKLNEILEFIER